MIIYAKDFVSFTVENSINDYGIEFIVKINAENEQIAIQNSGNIIEIFVNLLCLSTLCFAEKPEILTIIRKEPEDKNSSTLFLYPNPNKIFFTKLCIIDHDLLREVMRQFSSNSNQDRLIRAITWLRKGLMDEYLDEFISFWIALEILSPIVQKIYLGQIKKGDNWGGVKKVFSEYLDIDETQFERIKQEYRQGIIHGYKELDLRYINELNEIIPLVRRGVLACICKILNISKENSMKIILKEVRKSNNVIVHRLDGIISEIPEFDEKSMVLFPKMQTRIKSFKIKFAEDNSIETELDINAVYIGTENSEFLQGSHKLFVDKKSGIERVITSDIHIIEKPDN